MLAIDLAAKMWDCIKRSIKLRAERIQYYLVSLNAGQSLLLILLTYNQVGTALLVECQAHDLL